MAVAQLVSAGPADVAGSVRRAWAAARERLRSAAVDVVGVGLAPLWTWARGATRDVEGRLLALAWPWAAWLALLSPLRWWSWGLMVLPEILAQVPEVLARVQAALARVRPVLARVPGALAQVPEVLARVQAALARVPALLPHPRVPVDRRARSGAARSRWRARAAGRSDAARDTSPADVRPRRGPRPRLLLQVGVWAVVVAGVGAFAASLAVPLWYQLHGQRLLIVTSGSMAPFVEAGDVAVLQEIDDPSQLRVGQVATFWPPGSKHLVTHRIVDLKMLPALIEGPGGKMIPQLDGAGDPIMRPYIYTKGDANATRDPNATPLVRVRGVVVDSHPGWGSWLGWAQSPAGRFALLAPPLALLALLEVLDAAEDRRRRAARRRAPARDTVIGPSPAEVRDALGAS